MREPSDARQRHEAFEREVGRCALTVAPRDTAYAFTMQRYQQPRHVTVAPRRTGEEPIGRIHGHLLEAGHS